MKFCTHFLVCVGVLSGSIQATAQLPTPLQVELQSFAKGLSSPVGIYNCGDQRMFILEQSAGDIEILDTYGNKIGKFLDLTGLISTGGERGLLGLAFHPNYSQNGYFFVNYTNNAGNTVVARYTVSADPNVADPTSAQIIMTINQPYGNHNGGHIEFGPDGHLYIGMGDGGSAGDPQNYSQNNSTLLGKMLRINVDGDLPYTIPDDNPYVGNEAILDEIWAFGVRNPWKFSFDRETGDMWMGDVGQNAWEEVNFQPASSPGGENYGWRCYEGNAPYNTSGCLGQANYDAPIAVVSHGGPYNWCSITGGVVYRGENYPGMQGTYLFTDYCAGNILAIKQNGDDFDMHEALSAQGFGFVAFGENAAGEVFLAKVNNGTIYRIVDTCGDFMPTLSVDETSLVASAGAIHWWYLNGVLIAEATGATYTPSESGTYTVVVSNGSGCSRESNAIEFDLNPVVQGCTNPDACNYNPIATEDDGSCAFPDDACDDNDETTENDAYNENCECVGTVIEMVLSGDTTEAALNNDVVCEGATVAVTGDNITNVEESHLLGLEIYPNPASESITVDPGSYDEIMRIEIFDLQGRIVHSEIARGITSLPVVHFAAGTYVLRGTSNGKQGTKIIMVSR